MENTFLRQLCNHAPVRAVGIVLALLLTGAPVALSEEIKISAQDELHAAIMALKQNHMNARTADWPKLESAANGMLTDDTAPSSAYPAIRYLISALGEKHTFLIPSDSFAAQLNQRAVGSAKPAAPVFPEGFLLEDHVGLIVINGYEGSKDTDEQYANTARKLIARLAENGACRFLIDLRNNGGGNMYPMLNGLDALLGDEPYGYFLYAGDAKEAAWKATSSLYPNGKPTITEQSKITLKSSPVAVMVAPVTASAGEFVAMAFEGRPNTKIFGQTTAGLVTFNILTALPDGAQLGISEDWGEDRNHVVYKKGIAPDAVTSRGQDTIDSAMSWLDRKSCQGM